MSQERSPRGRLLYGLLKFAALLLGLFVAVASGAALLSPRIGVWPGLGASVVAFLALSILVGVLLREAKNKEVVTDVLAVGWMLFAFVIAGLSFPAVSGPIARGAEHLREQGHPWLAASARWVAGPKAQSVQGATDTGAVPEPPLPEPEPAGAAGPAGAAEAIVRAFYPGARGVGARTW